MHGLHLSHRGLTYLFDTLKTYGGSFSRDFWEVVSKGVLFPIFDDLRLSKQEHTKFPNKEDMSVWLSTTLIQALRQFVDLFSHYFEALNFQLDGVFELLTVCMTQGEFLSLVVVVFRRLIHKDFRDLALRERDTGAHWVNMSAAIHRKQYTAADGRCLGKHLQIAGQPLRNHHAIWFIL
jgi:hypothetical protein